MKNSPEELPLVAVARKYGHELPEPLDDSLSYDILEMMVENLHDKGYF